MKKSIIIHSFFWIIGLSLVMTKAHSSEITVAVASNFSKTLKVIAEKFENETGNRIKISSGSTGKHYAQIINGAPYHIFFAADELRPKMLETNGSVILNSKFTYAIGAIVLWSGKSGITINEKTLKVMDRGRLAYANPKLAPYGRASKEVMMGLGVWEKYKRKAVRGENIGQTFQFVKSGNVKMGFISSAQIMNPGKKTEGSFWIVPNELYSPINQQVILLKENPVASAFLAFIKTVAIQNIIKGYGYGVVEGG